jgi:hypothetical protein
MAWARNAGQGMGVRVAALVRTWRWPATRVTP